MSQNLRKYFIAGNWKMNNTAADAVALVRDIHASIGRENEVQSAVCPAFTSLQAVGKLLEELGSTVCLGAQNMHYEPSGAYTGEIAPAMLREFYCQFVILGHSERRAYFGETDALINKKVKAAFESNLKPILCVGETIEEREADKTLEVVGTQMKGGLADIDAKNAESLVIAYEPVWAIGTGKVATPEMAQDVHAAIRQMLTDQFGDALAQRIRILYGGSMKPENASELLDQPDIDGGLIGGAALKAHSFCKLVEIAREKLG